MWCKIILGVSLLSVLACTSPRYQGPVSDHFDGKRFFSPYGLKPKGFTSLLKWQIEGGRSEWPAQAENRGKPALVDSVTDNEVAVTFVNHITFLLQFKGLNVLTDPVWAERASPVSFAGPKRVRAPGLEFDQLPRIDLVVISHNHYDHFDLQTIEKLHQAHKPLFLVALGDGRLIEHIPGLRFEEMDWWQFKDLESGHRVHFLPAQHWSARGLFDRNMSLWGSYMIESSTGPRVYFGGDTGYSPHFKEVAAKFPVIDLAFLPIGAYEPRWFMKDQHMNPEDAVLAHQDLKPGRSIGTHFGTWQLTNEGLEEPVKELIVAREKAGLSENDFFVLDEGETRRFQKESR